MPSFLAGAWWESWIRIRKCSRIYHFLRVPEVFTLAGFHIPNGLQVTLWNGRQVIVSHRDRGLKCELKKKHKLITLFKIPTESV